MAQSQGLPEHVSNSLLSNEISNDDAVEEAEEPLDVLYAASFKEFSSELVRYETIIWLSISVPLVFAWGIGILMLLYLPYKRYVLRKDIASRKLYVTSQEIIYKVSRPSYIPFWGETKIKRRVPVPLIIDIVIEQGCLQSSYGLHTFKVESIANGKAAPVDELRVQGVSNPSELRKIILEHASKAIRDSHLKWSPSIARDGSMYGVEALTLGPAVLMSPAKSSDWKRVGSARYPQTPTQSALGSADLLLNKLAEVNNSVKKIELLIERNRIPAMQSLEDE